MLHQDHALLEKCRSYIKYLDGPFAILLYIDFISQTSLFELETQRFDITSLQGKNNDLRIDVPNIENKLREVSGEKIRNDYIVIMKDDFLSSVRSLAGEAKRDGAAVQHIYDHALPGFTIKVPNDKVLEAIMENPEVDYVQPDVKVKAFIQSLPTGVNRADGDLS